MKLFSFAFVVMLFVTLGSADKSTSTDKSTPTTDGTVTDNSYSTKITVESNYTDPGTEPTGSTIKANEAKQQKH